MTAAQAARRFILQAARTAPDLEAADAAAATAAPDQLLNLAIHHRLQVAAADLAHRLNHPQPALEAERLRVTAAGLEAAGRLATLTAHLTSQGIRSVALKGPVQSLRAFGNPAQRDSDDLDILVAEADAPGAQEALEAQGYTATDPYTPQGEHFRRRYTNAMVLSDRNGHRVDLHWRPTEIHFGGPPAEAVLRTAVPVALAGAIVFAPEPATELVLAACHAAKHGFARLDWLAAIARLAPLAEASTAAEIARRHQATRRLATALRLAAELEQGTLDPAWAAGRPEPKGWAAIRGHLAAADNPKTAAALLLRLAVTPNSADLRRARGGRAALYAKRPVRLLNRLVFTSDRHMSFVR